MSVEDSAAYRTSPGRCTGRRSAPRAHACDTPEIRDRLHDLAAQLRADEKVIIPHGEGNLASPSRWRRQMKFGIFRVMRPISWRYDRLIADHAELTTSLAERLMAAEAEIERLRTRLDGADAPRTRPREGRRPAPTDGVRARRGGDPRRGAWCVPCAPPATTRTWCRSRASGTRRRSWPTRWPCGARFDITESNGLKVDAVIALKFPAYLVEHERKIVWLIHQHRTAYELWDHPTYADLSRQDDGSAVRDMVWNADRLALNEAKRVFTNSRNVQGRLWSSLRIAAEVLYHPSGVAEHLLDAGAPGRTGRLRRVPQQDGEPEATVARDRRDGARPERASQLVLVGKGPDERAAARPDRAARAEGSRAHGDRRPRRAALSALRGGPRRLLWPVRRGLRLRDDRGLRRGTSGGDAHRQRRSVGVRDRRRDRTVSPPRSPRRSPRRSTGSSPIGRPPDAWAGPATRSCAPRSRDGPTSSRGCWTR